MPAETKGRPAGWQVHVEERAPEGERTRRASTTNPQKLSGISVTPVTERHEALAQNEADYEGTQTIFSSQVTRSTCWATRLVNSSRRWRRQRPDRGGSCVLGHRVRYTCGEGGAGVQSTWPASALVRR